MIYLIVGLPLLILLFPVQGAANMVSDAISGLPTTYDKLFQQFGTKYGVDWKILKRICMIESSLGRAKTVARGLTHPNDVEGSKSYDGKSWGIMQVTLTTAKDFDPAATEVKLNDPTYSVELAARYISWVMGRFPKTESRYEEWVIKSYNQGVGNSAKERAGTSAGFAHDYWTKYKKYKEQIP